jgi:hypothetical protein
MKLIFIHGRAQAAFEAEALKQTWIDTFKEGLAKNNLELPANLRIEFPYYGKKLDEWVDNPNTIPKQQMVVRSGRILSEAVFSNDFLNELLVNSGEKLEPTRGLLNMESVQKLLKRLDAKDGWGEKALKLFTKDVFLYLSDPNLKQALNNLILSAFDREPCVVVAHSLGTIVSYNLLKTNSELQVKKFITLGSPLGLVSVKKQLPPPIEVPKCVQHGWFNAYDERDFVALNPLDSLNFPVAPPSEIENKGDLKNKTSNNHGIVGYLNDAVVAKTIYDALHLP